MREGDWLGLRVTNNSDSSVDVSVLFVDSNYGIQSIYPQQEDGALENNWLPSGKSEVVVKGDFDANSLGREYFVVLGVTAGPSRIEFSSLAQPPIGVAARSNAGPSKQLAKSPLGRILQTALYAKGNFRGNAAADARQHSVKIISLRVFPKQ